MNRKIIIVTIHFRNWLSTDCLKAARDDDALISLEIEFHSFGAESENDLSKIDVLDLGTNKESSFVDRKARSYVSDIGVSKIAM